MRQILARLLALDMATDEAGEPHPSYVRFDANASDLMEGWRQQCHDREMEAEGLLMSHIGKFPGLAARLPLLLAAIDHAFDGAPQPSAITTSEFGRARHDIEAYALPMPAPKDDPRVGRAVKDYEVNPIVLAEACDKRV
jgi:hypothetical protein